MLVVLSVCYVLTIKSWPIVELFTLFSNWILHFQTLHIILTMLAVRDRSIQTNTNLKASLHLLYTMCILGNLVVVVMYWNFIHHLKIGSYIEEGDMTKVVCQYMVHIVPGVCCLIHSWMTNCLLSMRVLVPLLFFSSIYLSLNFCVTKIEGKPLYPFLTWESVETLYICLAMLGGFSIVFYILCVID